MIFKICFIISQFNLPFQFHICLNKQTKNTCRQKLKLSYQFFSIISHVAPTELKLMIVFSKPFHLKMSRTLLTPSFWRIIFSGGGENAVKSAGFFSFKTNGDFELMFQRAGEVLVCCILCWIQRQCSWELHLLSSCGMSYHSVSAIE